MQSVVDLMLRGKNATEISRELGITRAKVLDHIDSWRKYAVNDNDIKARAKETLARVNEHYQTIIKELWKQYQEADNNGQVREATGALKIIAQVEKDRAGLFQQAGITADDQLTEQLMETERKQEILMGILREIDCVKCRPLIRSRLAEVTGQAEVIKVVEVHQE